MSSPFTTLFKIAKQLLQVSKKSKNSEHKRMYSRSAINRFYYSTFLILRKKMVNYNKKKDPTYSMKTSGKIHQDVYNYVKFDSHKELSITKKKSLLIHKKYKKLKKMRNKADYNFDLKINELEADKQYKNSKEIINTILSG